MKNISRRELLKSISICAFATAAFSSPARALFRVAGSSSNSIGGVAIGTPGSSGIYSGYTMAGGDDFTDQLNVVNVNSPNAKYFPTIVYEAGARGTTSLLSEQWDSDPYNTGYNDINRGIALGSNNMSQANSILTLGARIENAYETGKIGSGRSLLSSMIHSGGYFTFSAPCVVEAYCKFSGGTIPSGWHTDFWLLNAFPLSSSVSSPDGNLEIGNEANTSTGTPPTGAYNLLLPHGTVAGVPYSVNNGNLQIYDGNWHLLSMVLGASSIQFYMDGVQVSNFTGNSATSLAKSFYILFTSHIINPTTISDWTTAGQAGVSMQVDYYRVWIPNANYPNDILSPAQQLPTIQVPYNTSMTYTFPSVATLWGAGFSGTDYCQGIKFEDYEPGSDVAFAGEYLQFPSGLTWNTSTRVLTGVTTDMQPGRIHTAAMPYIAGGTIGYVARGYIDVGPNVTETTASYSNGTGSLDMYFVGNCGTLVPKTISITGLPSGLTFSPTTNMITGTATPGTYPIPYSVTNAVGQNATQTISLTVGS